MEVIILIFISFECVPEHAGTLLEQTASSIGSRALSTDEGGMSRVTWATRITTTSACYIASEST